MRAYGPCGVDIHRYDMDDLGGIESKDRNVDLVKLAFWTCLQLERFVEVSVIRSLLTGK